MTKRILLIDDDPAVLKSLNKLFRQQGYDVVTAQSGEEALKIVENTALDLVIADVRIPGIDGVETAKAIKNRCVEKDRPELPVMFITGYADIAIEKQAQDLGEVFVKPFDNKEVLEKVEIETERVPHDARSDYTKDFVRKRREWLSKKTGTEFTHVSYFSTEPGQFRGNIENFVGVAQVPIGIVGPLVIKGDFAKGVFYVPFATTEGALVETYQRGAIALARTDGIKVFINKEANHLDPIFLFKSSIEARNFVWWIKNNFGRIKKEAESTTGFGKLISITPYLIGRRVALDLAYYTRDAMGANMIGIATEKVCKFISNEVEVKTYFLRSNFSSEKKASAVNLLIGYGKEVSVEAIIPRKILKRYLHSTPEAIQQLWYSCALSSFCSGMFGINAHFANGLAAMFIAFGQDVAHVANASIGIQSYEITEAGDLYAFLRLPNIITGTVGGGTALGTQRECLEMVGCYGKGKARKFAEIVGAALLAGEIGICAGITATDEFLDPHKRARAFSREKAYQIKKDSK